MNNDNHSLDALLQNIEKAVIGKSSAIKKLTMALLCGGHVLIEDVPGVGKTTLAHALAKSIQGDFQRIQFTPDVLPSDITGFSIYNPSNHSFDFKEGVVMTNILLADEINRTPPKTQSSLMEAMEEKKVTVDGKNYALPQPFMVIATQNPVEYLGTYPLPEAQLDRFMIKLSLGYPKPNEEWAILKAYGKESPLKTLTSVISCEEIMSLHEQVKSIEIEESLYDYIIEVVQKTRTHPHVRLGASPRASLHLALMARASAYLNDRNFITPDDIKNLAADVLAHRLILHQDAQLKQISPRDIINEILMDTPLPKVGRP